MTRPISPSALALALGLTALTVPALAADPATSSSTAQTPAASAPAASSTPATPGSSTTSNSMSPNSMSTTSAGTSAMSTAPSGPLDIASLREVDDDDTTLRGPNGMTVDQLDDIKVVTSDGSSIGEVDEVLANGSNQIVAVTVEVGGFMGMGEKEVVIGLDQLTFRDNQFVTTMSSDTLKTLPEWKK